MRDAISDVFAALSDPTRRALFERLLERPHGATATELSDGADVSRQAIVKHLQVLARSGLARPLREGREVRYCAASAGASEASIWLSTRARDWDRRVAALEAGLRARRGATGP